MPKLKRVSQTRIAQDLGISQALVSLVLNGRKTRINAETYKRIWAHAESLGYSPRGMRLDPKRTNTRIKQVGFILRAGLRPYKPTNFFGHVQHGLHESLAARGHTAVLLGSEDLLTPEKLRRPFRPGHALQGVVLLGEVARPFLAQLLTVTDRVVAISARYPGLTHSVQGNDLQALDLLVRHLYELGHRRFAWLGGNVGLGRHELRLDACKAALQAVGLALDPRYCVALEDGDRTGGVDAVHLLLPHARRRDFPTALICYNSTMAAGAIKALVREGWTVPQDLSVAGADISRINTEETPRITGAGTNPEKMGEVAARLVLDDKSAEEGFVDLVLPAQLLAGETTGSVSS